MSTASLCCLLNVMFLLMVDAMYLQKLDTSLSIYMCMASQKSVDVHLSVRIAKEN